MTARHTAAVASLVKLCQLVRRHGSQASAVARSAGEVVGEGEHGLLLLVDPSEPAWQQIRVFRTADDQVDHVDLIPTDSLELPLAALESVFGRASEPERLHWEDEPTVDFAVRTRGCTVFAHIPHPVLHHGRSGVRRVTIRRDRRRNPAV